MTGLGAPGGLAEGGVPELVALAPRRALRSRTGSFEFGDAALEGRDALVTLQTSGASHRRHDAIIGTQQAGSCIS